jgi:hypothetical protein
MKTNIGERSRAVKLSLAYRSTRGSQHVIRLPDGAEISSVSIDGKTEPLRAEAGELSIPILPGEHRVNIAWRNQRAIANRETVRDVDLAAAASNINLAIELPHNRWVLATSGPRLGPAVMQRWFSLP